MGIWKKMWDGAAPHNESGHEYKAVVELDIDGVFVNDDPLKTIKFEALYNAHDRVTKQITLVTKRKTEVTSSSSSSSSCFARPPSSGGAWSKMSSKSMGFPDARQLNAADLIGICSC